MASIVDYMKQMGFDPSFDTRSSLWSDNFDSPYIGSAAQNMMLLRFMEGNFGKAAKQREQARLFQPPKQQQVAADPRFRVEDTDLYRKMQKIDEHKRYLSQVMARNQQNPAILGEIGSQLRYLDSWLAQQQRNINATK